MNDSIKINTDTDDIEGVDPKFFTPKKTFETTDTGSSSFAEDSEGWGEEGQVRHVRHREWKKQGNFFESLFETSSNSPPQKEFRVPDMTKQEVEKQMRRLTFLPLNWLSRQNYLKIAWVVGKDFEEEELRRRTRRPVQFLVGRMLNEKCALGKRFHAIYNTKRRRDCRSFPRRSLS
jgi:hypothetical protein